MVNHLHLIQVYLMFLCFSSIGIQSAYADSGIGEYRQLMNHSEETKTVYIFKSFSIIDLSLVDIYVNHQKCNGDLGSFIFHNPLQEEMSNVEVSLDGGVNYIVPWLDNFGNVAVIDIEIGSYEVYIRSTTDDQEERFLGNYQILNRDQVDLDRDGITACNDSNDRDPCMPNDCDASLGIGCDLSIDHKPVYEYCNFENILNPEESAYPLSLDINDSEGLVSYNWSTGDSTAVVMVNPITNSKYYVTVSDESGCILNDSIELVVHFIPEIEIDIKHVGCNDEPAVMTLFSPIGDDLNQVEISMDGGLSFYTPTMDNFGNIVEFGPAEGNYDISIRHKDHTHCEKDLKNIDIRHQSFFDEDEDGFDSCVDPDDDDECVPTVCENCDTVNKTDFEDDEGGWNLDSDMVMISEDQAFSGQTAVRLINQDASITSEEFDVDDYMSIKYKSHIYSNSLEFEENISLLLSIDGGDSFTVIDNWSSLNDFHNGNWFEITYNGAIPEDAATAIFRLLLNANSSNDDIFIDNIEIELCEIQYSESESIECNVVNYDDVDSFRDFWKFGGPDALLSTKHANSGQFSYHLKNGNGTASSIISSSFSVPASSELEVSFVYTPISMERSEFLALEVSTNNGLTFVPYSSWVSGNFVNGETSHESVAISFHEAESDIRIRFTCHANSQYDHVYLDDIKIELCFESEISPVANQIDIEDEKGKENNGIVDNGDGQGNLVKPDESTVINVSNLDMTFFPNPSHDEIRFSKSDLDQADQPITLLLSRTDGTQVKQLMTTIHNLTRFEISDLAPGIYLVHVFDDHKVYLKEKLVKL